MLKPRTLYFRNQVQPFVILFVERSGSTFLASLLDSHPDIVALREVFAELHQQGKNATEQLEWMHDFFTPKLICRTKARGFKSKLVDILNPADFADMLRKKRCRVIQLRRHNSVKAVISTINAKRLWESSGRWNLLDESDRMPSFAVDLAEFDTMLQERARWDRELDTFVQELALPVLPLYYEDLLQEQDATLNNIFAFLNVVPKSVKARTLKNTNDNLRQVITNFDALRTQYLDTPYETLFSEVLI